jgi:hypothetical protein
MSRWRENIGKQFHSQYPQKKKNQIPSNKLSKGCEWPLEGEL